MISIKKDTEAHWIQLNEYQQRADANFDSRPIRDLERQPWTDEDNEATRLMVQHMNEHLVRIEARLAVIYRITHSALKTIRAALIVLPIAAVAYFIAKIVL